MSHCQVNHGLAALGERLVVLAQATVSPEPRKGSLDDPTLGQNHEPCHVVVASDDLQNPPAQFPRPFDQLTRITSVGPDQFQPTEATLEQSQHELGSVAVLNVGRMYHDRQHQAQRVYDDMTLAAIDLLAGVVSTRPPFSTVFTDWLSMIAAEGVGFRPSWIRTCRRRVS
jgi:hypothetical protein